MNEGLFYAELVTRQFLTRHFTWAEVERSRTATRLELTNAVPVNLIPNVRLAAARMELVRALLSQRAGRDVRIVITSWYRAPLVNEKVGSKPTSVHPLGGAVDFVVPSMDLDEAFNILRNSGLPYDQIIIERDRKGSRWIHIGWMQHPRRQSLMARFNAGLKRMVFGAVREDAS